MSTHSNPSTLNTQDNQDNTEDADLDESPSSLDHNDDEQSIQHAEQSTSNDNVMLTTVDNPFNPFTQFDEWLRFDTDFGYYSNALLARVMVSSESLSDSEQLEDYENAIDEIVRENVSGMHRKVYKDS